MSDRTSTLGAPLWGLRYQVINGGLHVPRPRDEPRVHAAGVNPDRVLVFGTGMAVGWGALSHELALPGYLARSLAQRTGRGADVDVIASVKGSCDTLVDLLAGVPLSSYDAVVVILGVSDALQLRSGKRWLAGIAELLLTLRAATSTRTEIVVMGIQAPSSIPEYRIVHGGVVDRHTEYLNSLTRTLEEDRVHFLSAPTPRRLAGELDPADSESHRARDEYGAWASVQGDLLAPLLNAHVAEGRTARAIRNLPQAVDARVSALRGLGILDTPPENRFDEIVESARQIFGTEGAAFNLIDRDRQWSKAMIGPFSREALLDDSICALAIREDAPLIIEDTWLDERIQRQTGVRFYAGFPIEALDGTRVGALCVFDRHPRSADTVSIATLRDLALAVQHQLAVPAKR